MEIFSERLTELRQERNISKNALAKKLGVSEPTISRWEHNIITPNIEKLCDIAKFFNVSTDYLLGLTDYIN